MNPIVLYVSLFFIGDIKSFSYFQGSLVSNFIIPGILNHHSSDENIWHHDEWLQIQYKKGFINTPFILHCTLSAITELASLLFPIWPHFDGSFGILTFHKEVLYCRVSKEMQ
jgi:hypothetical protein